MKTFALALSLLLVGSAASFAADPSLDAVQVARLLVNNHEIVQQLHEAGTDYLSKVTVTKVQEGVNQYELTFTRNCMCVPATATATIVENLRPTFSDGAPEYTSSFRVK